MSISNTLKIGALGVLLCLNQAGFSQAQAEISRESYTAAATRQPPLPQEQTVQQVQKAAQQDGQPYPAGQSEG